MEEKKITGTWLKIVIIGDQGVGKTALLDSL
jgi:GTPase SAR1 family protein